MGSIEGNYNSAAHLFPDEADLEFSGFAMTTANSPSNNLRPWKPSQSGDPTGRPIGTRGHSTDGRKEHLDALGSHHRGHLQTYQCKGRTSQGRTSGCGQPTRSGP